MPTLTTKRIERDVLLALKDQKNSLVFLEISCVLGVNESELRPVIDELEKEGLVRILDQEDRSRDQDIVILTDKARRTIRWEWKRFVQRAYRERDENAFIIEVDPDKVPEDAIGLVIVDDLGTRHGKRLIRVIRELPTDSWR